MMTSVSGKRGIGKTYHLAKEVYRRYLEGYFIITNFSHVYSNIDFSQSTTDDFYQLLKEILLFKEMGYEICDLYPEFEHTGIFIAIDEGHLYFSADLYKRYQDDPDFQDIIKMLAQARKQDIEIWYTTQDPAKIDKNWRRYTEEYIRYVPVLNLSRKVLIPHESKPIYRREMRHMIPFVWEERHELDHNDPVFDYSKITDDQGFSSWSPKSTLLGRKLRRSGWLDPFPYRLYDSNQVLAVKQKEVNQTFENIKNFAIVSHTFQQEKFPVLKGLFHLPRKDAKLPIKKFYKGISLPAPEPADTRANVLKQPMEFVEDMKALNAKKARAYARFAGKPRLKKEEPLPLPR